MKAHKVALFITDLDEVGAEEIGSILKNTRYPNRRISPDVASIETIEIGEWHDQHPLNMLDQQMAEYQRLFPPPEAELQRLRGIIARFAAQKLSGENGKFYITAQDIEASIEVLKQEREAGRFKE